jgi:hypothetical protein
MTGEVVMINYSGRGPVAAYQVQLDQREPGVLRRGSDPWNIGFSEANANFKPVLAAKRLRLHVSTGVGRFVDDLDLAGIREAHQILLSPRCK